MAAKEWLLKYGYIRGEDGRYRRPKKFTQIWEPVDDGWLRFEPDGLGNEVPEIHSVKPEFGDVSGMTKQRNPEAFVWVYPDKEVEKIYRDAYEAAEPGRRHWWNR